ncbi:MAG: alkaline phosphatase family protein [Candidatus Binataceae bacterium]
MIHSPCPCRKRLWRVGIAILAALICAESSCTLAGRIWSNAGEKVLKPAQLETPPPPSPVRAQIGPHVLIFALDGAGHDQLMAAIFSGKAPNMAALLGEDYGSGVFDHGYSAPATISVLPSSTIADWSAIFTGQPPAVNGVTGDEWFERDKMQFFAPVPVSVHDTTDLTKALTEDLVGKQLETPTLYQLVKARSYVSLLAIYHGATLFTTFDPNASFPNLVTSLIKGELAGESPEKSLSARVDLDSAQKVGKAINEHGMPDLQVVYFPGIDIFTHVSKDPLKSQVAYLENVTDKGVGEVLNVYRQKGVFDHTYVIFIADHGHIPTLADERHAIDATGPESPSPLLEKTGFRVRKPAITLANGDQDYQAVLAYQGFMAYLYLADRATCPKKGDVCEWKKPPRYYRDVLPVLRGLFRDNRTGLPVAQLKGSIDLIFSRRPAAPGKAARPFEIFDGRRLVPIDEYLKRHPRPDLVELKQRMDWLGAGPHGDRAGDIVLLARACMDIPIQDRYYFAAETHYSWHGSACLQDSHVPLILAQPGGSGEDLEDIVEDSAGDAATEMDLTPLVRALLKHGVAAASAR